MISEKIPATAIVPGSFDPMTVGHLDIVRRAAKAYEKVYLAVLINPSKEYLFDMETRKKIAEASVSDIENVTVVSDKGMLTDLARRLSCRYIVKGIRNEADLEYEREMALYNKNAAPEIETVLLPCDAGLSDVSSSRVRELLAAGETEELKKLLPAGALEIVLDAKK